ncbi:protein of unknown function [Nitrospira japonica]|uniref:Response regulatory domain-containing protein n=1 Tax=Nitrospira japonica TaxID=1325564 RepID=A0A1W1I1J2_9BACT|nr:protein of unknown function [Nitrospira japonica]
MRPCTVHNAPQIEKRIMEAGAAAFLSKEVAVDSLYKTIHAVKPRTRAVD